MYPVATIATYIGHSGDTDTELTIPWDCIGQPDSTVRLIVVVQDESTGAVSSVHPSQTIATGAVVRPSRRNHSANGSQRPRHRYGSEEPPANLPQLRWI